MIYLNGDRALLAGEAIVEEAVLGGSVVDVEVLNVVVKQDALGICVEQKRQRAMRNSGCDGARAYAPVPKGTPSVNSFIMDAASVRTP